MFFLNCQKGQSFIEILVALGVFVVIASVLGFLILDSYSTGQLARQLSQANFLAREGLEAVTSIRDNNWDDLVVGSRGLAISENRWVFQGTEENLAVQLKEGVRRIIIEDIGDDRKKIISQVSWQFTDGRPQLVQLVTYLTNWQKISLPPQGYCSGSPNPCGRFENQAGCINHDGCFWTEAHCQGTCTPCSQLKRGQCRQQDGCSWFLFCYGNCVPCNTYLDRDSCRSQLGCSWRSAVCEGTPTPCENYTSESECTAQTRCRWTMF